ncbi:MAG: hypothetical protein PHR30_17620 [Gallionellaceae bacterium]|nr:hypothetical protein [Gallionellaceae bacterium]
MACRRDCVRIACARLACWLLLATWAGAWPAQASASYSQAAALQAKYAALADRLRDNPFRRALYLESSESAASTHDLKGDIYALVDYPFTTVSSALDGPDNWCDVLILHINTKYCHAATAATNARLTVSLGRKYPQSIDEAYPVEFAYRTEAAAPDYLDIRLTAGKGPLGTSNYRIQLQAVPVAGGRTFLHLTYSCAYGLVGQLAMKTYLATLASAKVGFTVVGRQADGQPEYIGGLRGVVERNTMRYYLAIDAYLAALAAPPALRLDKRLQGWYDATEQYPRQLHEVGRADYLDMKRQEYRRQQAAQ